ncbi:hypothetical protein AOE01nite_21800 [Acetobacter oeni]|uniref:Lipoprotein n=2 Tax=Acetobacter oeni TaxID=304077 RepID=A0A511XLZ9_9PROT|nr:hypothetical protein AOE01nite_21800 [Acetobacter oeni]
MEEKSAVMTRPVSLAAILALALSGCARHPASPEDPRTALLHSAYGRPPALMQNSVPDDGKMHGQITTGVATSSGRGRSGAVPMESADLTNVLPGVDVGAWSYGR